MMRTQGILLVRDAILLLSVIPTDGKHHASASSVGSAEISTLPILDLKIGLWQQSCDRTLASLEDLSQKLLENIKIFRDHSDKIGADVIGSSCITCLAHLAILCEVFSRRNPVARGMYDLCDSALQRLGMQTYELQLEEYTYLDLLLGVRPSFHYFPTVAGDGSKRRIMGQDSWKKSLQVFDARIENLPLEKGRSLRHFREIIGGKYSDLQAKLPDCEPSLMFSLMLWEDGTTKESKYPNLISVEARILHGV